MHSLIIVNPVSGAGNNKDRKKEIEKIASGLGWHGHIEETAKNITADKIVKKYLKKGVRHIIACGGDGTVMEAASALVDKNIPLSVVPLGTGNIFALNLGISSDIKSALTQAMKGKVKKIDMGLANKTFFGVNAGMGFDADMMKMAERDQKDKLGLFAYILAGIKLLPRKRESFTILIDDKKPFTIKARSVIIGNMEKTAAGIKIIPGANPKSGALKIGIIKSKYITDWLNILINALTGKINRSSHVELLSGKHIEIVPGRPMPYQCDGNVFSSTKKLSIDIYPQALTVKF